MPTTDIEDHNDIQLADGVTAYHGSPHEFEEFDLSKVGTGEAEIYGGKEGHIGGKGAEYGHGIYLTDSEDTANHYKEKLSKPGQGYLYEVNIAPKKENFLHWEKTLSEQDPFVRDSLVNSRINKKIPPQIEIEANYKNIDPLDHYRNVLDSTTGEQFYKSEASMRGDTAKASSALNNLGIPGIVVPHGERSNSYVVFDPKHIKVKRRYAEGGGIKAFAIGNSIPHLERASDMIDTHDDIQLAPGVEAIDEMPDQAFTSENTSRNQIPALFNSPAFERKRGSRNLDYGGGAFDKGTEYLAQEHGVESHVYDPFNREKEHNDFVLNGFKKEPADTATVANVLNVIAEPKARLHVIKQVHNHIKPDGKAYFTVYEGDGKDKGKGKSRMTRDGWQEYRPTHSYVEEIKQVFPDVRLSGKTIIASKKAAKAYGGAIYTPELQDDPDDIARRLILWSYAAAPLGRPLARAEGGSVDDPVNKASSIVGAPASAQNAVDIARNLNPMGFYSAAAEAASKFPQKAPIDQIISKIKGQPNVKTAELDNANLKDAFAGQRSVDPQEVARHLQENVPQISEKVYGGKPPVSHPAIEYEGGHQDYPRADNVYRVGPSAPIRPGSPLKENWNIVHNDMGEDGHEYNVYDPMGTYHDTFNNLDRATEYVNQSIHRIEPTQYHEYTIPGGENYREVVMSLGDDYRNSKADDIYEKMQPFYKIPNGTLTQEWKDLKRKYDELTKTYKSSHWQGVDNPLAHLRLSDRDNGKTLHLEELQSDWGQEGRKKGFAQKVTPEMQEKVNEIVSKLDPRFVPSHAKTSSGRGIDTDNFLLRDINHWKKTGAITPEDAVVLTNYANIKSGIDLIPAAPYVTDTNQWVDLGLKRALMEAAKGGYDKLVWTPGEAQADRYDLSKRIKKIVYDPDDKTLSYMEHGRLGYETMEDIPGNVEPHEIENHIGKEAASRLLATEPHKLSGNHILEGEDLKVGGEGMKSFYDKLVPQRLSKLISQHDPGAKVEKHSYPLSYEVGTGQTDDIDWEGRPVEEMVTKKINGHVLHITPKLRAAILKGLPAFEKGGFVANKAIGGGSFQGKKPPSIKNLARVKDKFIYHSGTVHDLQSMKDYLEPQHGDWIREIAEHSGYDNPDELLEKSTPLIWMSDKPTWVVSKVARKLNKSHDKVTVNDIREHGHVAVIPRKGDHADHVWRVGEEGLQNGPYSEVTNLNGEKTKAYNTDLFDEDKEPFGVERNEYISAQSVEPLVHLTGNDLVSFLRETGDLPKDHLNKDQTFAGGGSVIDAAFKVLSKLPR